MIVGKELPSPKSEDHFPGLRESHRAGKHVTEGTMEKRKSVQESRCVQQKISEQLNGECGMSRDE